MTAPPVADTHSPHAAAQRCPNCQHVAAPLLPQEQPARPHCVACGQALHPHAPSFWEFVHEFVGHYVALEGTLWPTLRQLFFSPGALTKAYLAGQRTRYVLPLRLFLTSSFLFFLMVKVLGSSPLDIQVRTGPDGAADLARCIDQAGQTRACSALESKLLGQAKRMSTEKNFGSLLTARFFSAAPYAVFMLVPVCAGIVQGAYWRRRRNYGEHFVFALHLHALSFLLMLLAEVLPGSTWALALVPMGAYLVGPAKPPQPA
jgi:hypothetical protein